MAEVNLLINGRSYDVACDNGQESRVKELAQYLDKRIKDISRAGAATNETHLLVLAGLVMADELTTLKEQTAGKAQKNTAEDDEAVAQAIDTLADRIDSIADRIQKA